MLDIITKDKEDKFSYKRKFFIKSLFSPKEIFSKFSIIEFEDITTFLFFLSKGYQTLSIPKEYMIHIGSVEHVSDLLHVLEETELSKKIMITFDIPNLDVLIELLPLFGISKLSNTAIRVSVNSAKAFMDIQSNDDHIFRNYLDRNGIWLDFPFNFDSYSERYEEVFKTHLQFPFIQLLDIHVDYVSFENCKFKDLNKLRFYINLIAAWIKTSYKLSPVFSKEAVINKEKNSSCKDDGCSSSFNTGNFRPKIRNSALRIFLSKDMNVYLSKDAYTNNDMYFELSKYLDKDGETIPYDVLGEIRQLVDVRFKSVSFKNLYMVDLYANLKIMKDLYVIPPITELIGSWLEYGDKNGY